MRNTALAASGASHAMPEAVHPGVDLQMYAQRHALRIQRFGVRKVSHGLRKAETGKLPGALRRCAAENEYRPLCAERAELRTLVERCRGERAHTERQELRHDGGHPVTIGIRLYDRHQLAPRRQRAAQNRNVVRERRGR